MPRYSITIPNYHTAIENQWDGHHWSVRAKLKKANRQMIAAYAAVASVPRAESRRMVSLVITLEPGQRAPDKDAWWKSLLDGLKACGRLVNDNPKWCEPGKVEYVRGDAKAITII